MCGSAPHAPPAGLVTARRSWQGRPMRSPFANNESEKGGVRALVVAATNAEGDLAPEPRSAVKVEGERGAWLTCQACDHRHWT